jgi:hypothetical protein
MYDIDIMAHGALTLDEFFLKLRRQCVRLKRRNALIQRYGVVSHDTRLSD